MPALSLQKIASITILGVLVWLSAQHLLPIALPFLLGAALAFAAEPLVRMLSGRLGLRRGIASGIGVTISLAVLTLGVLVLGALAVRQVRTLAEALPDLGAAATEGMASLENWMLSLAERMPESIRPLATRSVDTLFSDGSIFLSKLSALAADMASGIVSKLPGSALGIGTFVLSGFMFSARAPIIRQWVGQRLPQSWRERQLPMLRRMKGSVLGWLWAQLKLMAVTFGILAAGFLLLRIHHGFLWAGLIALMDALPVLGTGMVLVPWSIVSFLQGDTAEAAGLLGVYAVSALARSVLEPKLVGKQLGLDPLVTLIAMYAGYRLWGIPGMLLSPLLAVTGQQFFSSPAEN